jgi:hypothetical protein
MNNQYFFGGGFPLCSEIIIFGSKFLFLKNHCYFCKIQKSKDFYLVLNYEQAAISDISTPKKYYVKLIINKFEDCRTWLQTTNK